MDLITGKQTRDVGVRIRALDDRGDADRLAEVLHQRAVLTLHGIFGEVWGEPDHETVGTLGAALANVGFGHRGGLARIIGAPLAPNEESDHHNQGANGQTLNHVRSIWARREHTKPQPPETPSRTRAEDKPLAPSACSAVTKGCRQVSLWTTSSQRLTVLRPESLAK